MAELHKTAAALRFGGDDLEPEEISRTLGAPPTMSVKKGGIRKTPNGREYVSRTGIWLLSVPNEAPGDLDKQVVALFSMLTDNLDAWKVLASRYKGDIFAGLFLSGSNEGSSLSSATLHAIGSRGLGLDLDIYSGDDEDDVRL